MKCKPSHQCEKHQNSEAFYLSVDRQLNTNQETLKRFNLKEYPTVKKSDLVVTGFNPKSFKMTTI